MSSEPLTPDPLFEFCCEAWGHPERFLKNVSSDAGDIKYIDLGKYLDCVERCFHGSELGLIIIRDEYRLALKALQGTRYTKGAYVTGQPGIGKTFFLVYLLVYLLGQKTAVALQLPNEIYAFFTGECASIQSTAVVQPIDEYRGRIWGLCDSNHLITTPGVLLSQYRRRMQVVLTTSPNSLHWKEWAKQTGAWPYLMDVWSIEEVKWLAILSNLNMERMVECARRWGGAPRTILKYHFEPDDVIEATYRSLAGRAMRECSMMLARGPEMNLPDDAPSSFYFIRPRDIPSGRILPPYVYVPTRTLCCLLAEALQRQTKNTKLEFFRVLSTPSETRQAADDIYGSWFHSFLSTPDHSVECEWLPYGDGRQELSSPPNVISATQDMPAPWSPPFYWIPPNRNFPGIDSALVLTDNIITFHITMAKDPEESAVKQGLLDLRDLLPGHLRGLPWNLVFVGTDIDQIRTVAAWWAGKIPSPTGEARVRVGWAVVDPVSEDVVYKHHGDEDDVVI